MKEVKMASSGFPKINKCPLLLDLTANTGLGRGASGIAVRVDEPMLSLLPTAKRPSHER
jgi:hypothetical protein